MQHYILQLKTKFRHALIGLFSLLLPVMVAALTITLVITADSRAMTTIEIQDTVHLEGAKRLGINVGSRSQWGAAQILKNLIENPGFEAGEYDMIFHTSPGATGTRVQEDNWDTSWNNDTYNIGQPEGFWDGAEYEIVSGPAKGRAGTIINFTHEEDTEGINRYTYHLDSDGTVPNPQDAVYVRRQLPGFYSGFDTGFSQADPSEIRPGSPGSQSLRLLPPDEGWKASYAYYMDSYWRDGDQTAGKLLLIEGNWHIELWAKAANNGDTLEISFYREGENTFFNETIVLTDEWQHIQRDFYVAPGTEPIGPYPPGAYHPILALILRISDSGGDVWVDDIALYRSDYTNPTAFTDKYINALKELNPGILRDMGLQLGSTLDNQLAEPWARKTNGHSPAYRFATDYHYSLHEFLELAREVGAEPWYVIPPTFSLTDMENLVAYLAAPAGAHPYADKRVSLGQTVPWTEVFPVIHLEYGNEMWGSNYGGDPFIGVALRGGERLGQVANDRFSSLKSSPYYDPEKFNLIIGGQAGWAGQNQLIENNSSNHDTIALAPYFWDLDNFATDEEMFYPLFARPTQDVTTGMMAETQGYLDAAGQGTKLAVYEINFHTTYGSAPIDIRNDFVTGMGGAVALPLYMLTYQHDMGVKNQAVYQSLQYSTSFSVASGEYVRLWGTLRDIETTGRKRPTWLGVELTNRAIRGDMLVTQHGGDNPTWIQPPINGITEPIEVHYIQSFAFREGNEYSVMLFNLHLTDTQPVTLQLPKTPKSTATLYELTSASIHDDNEDNQLVAIQPFTLTDFDMSYDLALAPYSVYMLTWKSITFGDVNEDDKVSALDAARVLAHAVGLITLLGDALRAADVSDNGSITAYDAALILQFSVGLIDHFPADETQGISPYRAVTRQLDLTWQDEKARQFFIPVQIDEANSVLAYDLSLSYNPSILEIQEVRKIHPDDFLEYQADAGELKITLARTEPLQGQSTEMIIVGARRARRRQPVSLTLNRVELNEGTIPVKVRMLREQSNYRR